MENYMIRTYTRTKHYPYSGHLSVPKGSEFVAHAAVIPFEQAKNCMVVNAIGYSPKMKRYLVIPITRFDENGKCGIYKYVAAQFCFFSFLAGAKCTSRLYGKKDPILKIPGKR